jgi:tripartite-type tricarboxylate transporter receptor subunit TctC
MKLATRRIGVVPVCVAALTMLCTTSAFAQFVPSRPITIIIGVPAGGGADAVARLIGPKLTEALGQPVVVEPRPGANYLNSVRPVINAAPDGHTLLLASSGFAMVAAKPNNPPYDLARDLAPVSLVARGHVIMVASPKLPVNNVPEFIALAKRYPGKLSFGSGGTGTLFHLAAEYFRSMTKTNLFHVPYKGSVPALQDVMGGHIDFLFDNIGSNIPHVRSGGVKGLAVTSPQRTPSLPDIPTFAELGYPDYDVSQWYGLFAPPKTSPEIVNRLQAEVSKALAAKDVAERLYTMGNGGVGTSPAEFTKILQDEHARWSHVIRESGLDLQ